MDLETVKVFHRCYVRKIKMNRNKCARGSHGLIFASEILKLERDGLVNRTHHPKIPPTVEYNLTEMGQSFREPVSALGYWALKNLPWIDAARDIYDKSEAG